MFGNRESISVGKRLERAWLAVNAYLDASHFNGMRRMRDAWVGFSEWMDRFHVSGVSRLGVEIACEGLTLGLGGAILMLTLAQPAFRETGDDWLKKQDLAVTFLDRFGNPVGRRGILHDNSVPLAEIPDTLIKAVLATEDRRFYEHYGVDPIGTARALTVNARSTGVVQGGSTITQQLAKNLFLSNERTIERKIKEAFLAVWLEFHLTKKQILELYLDRAYMGGGTFGVQAATDFYFGKSVRDVTLAESAMLAGLFKAPTKFAPHINLPAARGRAADVLNNLVDAGFMTQSQIFGALRAPATPVDRSRESSPDWYLDWAFNEVKALADAGKLKSERVLTVRLALDSNVQRKADDVIETQLRENGRSYKATQSATVIMQVDGAVRAIVGGRDYGTSQFNRAVDAMRQPGSSFKPYVYLTALLSGKFKPTTLVTDSPVCIGNWCPRNYGGSFSGTVPLSVALAKSLNTIAVKLAIAVGGKDGPKAGRAKIVETARKMGVTAPLPDTVSLPIGADEVSVIEHSASYAVFGNGGKRVKAWAASEIMNGRGDVIWRHDVDGIKPVQVFPPSVINDMNGMLAGVVEAGTGRRAILGPDIKVGGKTGTTNGYKDAWFCGFTGNMSGCVWYGNDDDTAMNNMTGGTLPAQTWHDIMEVAHKGIELAPLPGVPVGAPVGGAQPGPAAASPMAELGAPDRPTALSRKSSNALGSIDQLIRAAGSRADAGTTISLTGGETRSVGGYMRIP